MKLLLDENLSWRLAKKMKVVFPEVVHVSSLNLKMPAKDLFIWQYAKERNFVIVNLNSTLNMSNRF